MAQIRIENLNWKPERGSQTPLHDQIAAWMKSQVASGAWPLGSRLPTQRVLAEALGVNRSTLIAALARLGACGIVEGKGASGTYVASNSWGIMLADRTGWGRSNAPTMRTNAPLAEAIRKKAADGATICLGSGALDSSLFPVRTWRSAASRLSSCDEAETMEKTLGLAVLRRLIAEREAARGIDARADQVLLTSGNQQSMRLVCQGMLEPGCEVLVARPTYAKALTALPDAGVRVVECATDDEGLEPDAFAAAASRAEKGCVLYAMPTNHNPTGRTMGPSRRSDLMREAARLRVPVIEDGSFDELCWGEQPEPLKRHDTKNNVIYLGNPTKSFAPGLRVGWIVAPSSIVGRLAEIQRATDYGAATPSQMMLTQLLESGAYDLRLSALREALETRCAAALGSLDRHLSGLATWTRPRGGYFVWLTFDAAVSKEQLFTEALAQGVMLNVHDVFDQRLNNSVRLSYAAVSPEAFDEGARRIAAIARKLA
jgi:GntR family transcriptional regulator of abcA and norABC